MPIRRLVLPAAVVAIAIIALAAAGRLPPGVVLTRVIPHGDLLVHALAYGTIAAAANLLVPGPRLRVGPVRLHIAGLVVLVLGLAEETLQGFDPSRQSTLSDALADVFGVLVIGEGLVWLAGRAASPSKSPASPGASA